MQTTDIPPTRKRNSFWKDLLLPMLFLFITIFSVAFSSVTTNAASEALGVCIDTVIPSLFPFLLLSSFLTNSGMGIKIGRLLSRPIGVMFGTSAASACPIALGFLCSFPTGAAAASEACQKGLISKRELSYLLTFINNPGAAFVFGAVGRALSSWTLGKGVYLCVMLSSAVAGVLSRLMMRPKDMVASTDNTVCANPFPVYYTVTSSIASASRSMVMVCASVITFSILSDVLCSVPVVPLFSDIIPAAISGFFEISGGVRSARLLDRNIAPFFCAAVCSWSGLSVHFQVMSVCRKNRVSFAPYVFSKLFQTLLSPILLTVYLKYFDSHSTAAPFVPSSALISSALSPVAQFILLLFVLSLLVLILKNVTYRRYSSYIDIKGGE